MRLFVKIMILVLLVALAGPFFITGPDGQPLMTTTDLSRSLTHGYENLKRKWTNIESRVQRAAGDTDAGQTRVHRWQDEQGQWHYSDAPPTDQEAEIIVIDPNINRMDAIPVPRATSPESKETPPGATVPLIPTPGRITETIDQAREAREQMERRNEELQQRTRDD